jgi:hypothetical protein
LTLNATIDWAQDVNQGVQAFLAENFEQVPPFGEAAEAHLGEDLYESIATQQGISLTDLGHPDRQRVLMTLVPKKVAHCVTAQGWQVNTTHNMRYGDPPASAAMVTWVFRFRWDDRSFATPHQVYRESLLGIHSGTAAIGPDGTVS